MIRTLCTCVVLSGVAGLSGVVTGHLWNRYADENGRLRFSGVYERILAAQAGFVADPRVIASYGKHQCSTSDPVERVRSFGQGLKPRKVPSRRLPIGPDLLP